MTLKDVVDAVGRAEPLARQARIVAIDGHGGSGKSHLADRLAETLGDAVVVRTDDFARPGVPGWEWERLRAQVLDPIERNEAGRYRRYDWATDRPAEWHVVQARGTVIVEGVSSLRDELGRYWDIAIWLDCPYDLRLARGIERDGEAMRSQWVDVWMPEEDLYVRRQRPDLKADIVIDSSSPLPT